MTPTFDAIGLVVADVAASLAFYRKLGVDIPVEMDAAPHAEANLGGVRLMWDTPDVIRSFDPQWSPATGGARMALAFRCATPDEVDDMYAVMVKDGHGGRVEPFDAPWGQRYAVLTDPDGNSVDLYAALPT